MSFESGLIIHDYGIKKRCLIINFLIIYGGDSVWLQKK